MREIVVAFLGGGTGTVLRYWLSGALYRYAAPTFPTGTLVVNVGGCLLIGLLMTVFEDRFTVQPLLRVFLTIGVLGGFTTFSTFSYETISLFREGSTFLALANIGLSVGTCLAGTWAGTLLGRIF
jgi:CrcB protein